MQLWKTSLVLQIDTTQVFVLNTQYHFQVFNTPGESGTLLLPFACISLAVSDMVHVANGALILAQGFPWSRAQILNPTPSNRRPTRKAWCRFFAAAVAVVVAAAVATVVGSLLLLLLLLMLLLLLLPLLVLLLLLENRPPLTRPQLKIEHGRNVDRCTRCSVFDLLFLLLLVISDV